MRLKKAARRTYIEKICLDCPKLLSRSCEGGRCKKCQTFERFSKIENHPRWIKDRTKLAKRQERNDSAYREWRKSVWARDNFFCQIKNQDCHGKIEAHHILSWSEHPELNYKVNNGITICHAHHPRARAE